jgi:hypothetical protein
VANSSKRRAVKRRCQKPLAELEPKRFAELAPSFGDQEPPLVVRPRRARRMLDDPAESTFWKWVRNGEFEVIRVGHLTFLTVRSVRDFLDRHTVGAA